MMDYKNAGVDIEAGYKSVELMKQYVKGTMRPEVLGGLGGFSGAFSMSAFKGWRSPHCSRHGRRGDQAEAGFPYGQAQHRGHRLRGHVRERRGMRGRRTPVLPGLYIACGKNFREKIATIVKGVAEGCKQSGAALMGGETAEIRILSRG